MTYRVVETDNYGRDYPDEKWALPYHLAEDVAKSIADLLNGRDRYSARYFKVVPVGYELQPGFEP